MIKNTIKLIILILVVLGLNNSAFSMNKQEAIEFQLSKLDLKDKAGVYPITITYTQDNHILSDTIEIELYDDQQTDNSSNDKTNKEKVDYSIKEDDINQDNKNNSNEENITKEKVSKEYLKNEKDSLFEDSNIKKDLTSKIFESKPVIIISGTITILFIILMFSLSKQYSKTDNLVKSTIKIFIKE